MAKNLVPKPILVPLAQICAPKIFCRFYLYVTYMLDIVAGYHCMQFQGKLMNQTWKNGKKKLVLGPILAHLAQIWVTNFLKKIWFCQSLGIMVSYYHVQYEKKLMI